MFNALLGSFVAWSLTAGALPGPWPAAASLALGGALLPQERLVLAQDAAVVVEYGNPVERGGASIVSQRIL